MKPGKEMAARSSRREFLRKSIKATGYAIPAVMVLRMGSTRAWAQRYEGQQNAQEVRLSDPCKGVLEKIFKPKCW